MKYYTIILLFLLEIQNVFSQEVFVSFYPGNCGIFQFGFFTVSEIPENIHLTVVVPQRYMPQGRKLIEDNTMIKRDFDILYSNSTFNTLRLENSLHSVLYINKELDTIFHIDLAELQEYMYMFEQDTRNENVVISVSDTLLLTNSRLVIEDEELFIIDNNNFLICNLETKNIQSHSSHSINSEQIITSFFTDTNQYSYLLEEQKNEYMVMAERERITFKSVCKSDNGIYVGVSAPYFDTKQNMNMFPYTGFLKYTNGEFLPLGEIIQFIGIDIVPNDDETQPFFYNQKMYFPFYFGKDVEVKNPYLIFTFENDKVVYEGIEEKIQSPFGLEDIYAPTLYSDNKIFFCHGNEFYNLETEEMYKLDFENTKGHIEAVFAEDKKIKILYREYEKYELLTFTEKKDATELISRVPVEIKPEELNSTIIFRDASSLLYVNFYNQVISLKL